MPINSMSPTEASASRLVIARYQSAHSRFHGELANQGIARKVFTVGIVATIVNVPAYAILRYLGLKATVIGLAAAIAEIAAVCGALAWIIATIRLANAKRGLRASHDDLIATGHIVAADSSERILRQPHVVSKGTPIHASFVVFDRRLSSSEDFTAYRTMFNL